MIMSSLARHKSTRGTGGTRGTRGNRFDLICFVSCLLSQGWFPAAYVSPAEDFSNTLSTRWELLSLNNPHFYALVTPLSNAYSFSSFSFNYMCKYV